MIKHIEFDLFNNRGEKVIDIIDLNPVHLEKVAEVSDALKEAIAEIKPQSGKVYILINAMGSGEYWGSNKNADYFPEKALQEYHKTFESAGVYKHHKNKDPKQSLGKVVFAHYNPEMHRVELLLEVDKAKAPDVVERIQTNSKVAVSMGCKVPYDICTICEKRASKADEYCDHIKKEKNKIYFDGRKVAMVNTRPRFFDISFVTIPADRTGYMMRKVAEFEESRLSAELGEEWLKENSLKESDIDKKIDSNVLVESEILTKSKGKLQLPREHPGDLPKEWLNESLNKTSASQLLTAMAFSQIFPTPKDFQYIVLKKENEKLAEELYEKNIVFKLGTTKFKIPSDWDISNLTDSAIYQCSKVAQTHSLTIPNIVGRELAKLADIAFTHEQDINTSMPISQPEGDYLTKNPLFALGLLSGLFYAFHRFGANIGLKTPQSMSALERAVIKHPVLLPILVGGVSLGAVKLQESLNSQPQYDVKDNMGYTFTKAAGAPKYILERLLTTIPATYVYGGYQETKRQRGQRLNTVQDFIRKHPFLSSVGAFAASKPIFHYGAKALGKFGALSSDIFLKLEPEKYDNFYTELINLT